MGGGGGVPGREFKISLFADDILLTLTQPQVALPNLNELLEEFRSLFGYKVNSSKSEALPLVQHLAGSFPYAWKSTTIRYLGINITLQDSLYKANFKALFVSIRTLLAKWKNYHISWLGRIASVKMAILPKILYYFMILSILVPTVHLRNLQADLQNSMWNYKHHRIGNSMLFEFRNDRGVAFPNLMQYYVTQLKATASWVPLPVFNCWTEIDKLWLASKHPNNLLWNTDVDTPCLLIANHGIAE